MDSYRSLFFFLLVAVVASASAAPGHVLLVPGFAVYAPKHNSCLVDGFNTSFLRDEESGECFKIHERGPCKNNMQFDLGTDGIYGKCRCEDKNEEGRPLLYWAKDDECYGLHEQGPCNSTEWLTYGLFNQAACTANPCADADISKNLYFYGYDGKCYYEGQKENTPCQEEFFLKRYGLQLWCAPTEELVEKTYKQQLEKYLTLYRCAPGSVPDDKGGCKDISTYFSPSTFPLTSISSSGNTV